MQSLLEPPVHAPAEPCGCTSCADRPKLPAHVHLFSGEFFEAAEDFRIPGRGLDFVWARKYRSRTGPNTAQGNRWDFSYNIRVEAPSDDTLKLFNGDGREDVFVLQRDGTYVRDEFFVVGRKNQDGTFTFTFSDNGTWNFFPLDQNAGGKISSIVDRNANRLAFRYDAKGRLTEIVDTLGRPISIAYNTAGFIESVIDFTGRRVSYSYYRDGDTDGSAGDLKSVTRPAVVGTPNGNDFPKGKTTSYTYSKDFAGEQLNHNLLTITDPLRQTYLKNIYSETVDPKSFDFGRLSRQIWGGNDSDTIDIVYVPQKPAEQNGHSIVMAIVNDRNRNVKEYLFDSSNRCVLKREYTGRAPRVGPTTTTKNRPQGQMRDDDPKFFETRYEWNSDSLLTRILHPNGSSVERQFEAESNSNVERRFRGNLRVVRALPGSLGAEQASLVQLFEYQPGFGCSCADSFVSKVSDPRGNVTVQRYDDRGNLLAIQHRIASIGEEFEYNKWGQLTRYVHPDNGSGHRRVDAYVYYTEADGHQKGFLKQEIIDASNFALTTTYEYDRAGNVTRIIDPSGHDSLYVWNQLDQVVRRLSSEINDRGDRHAVDFFYDANDNPVRKDVQERNDEGKIQRITTTREYDIFNQCTRISREAGPKHQVNKEFSYDQNGNLAQIRYGESTNGNQPANGVQMVYDERDLLFQKIRAAGNPLQSTTQSDYEPGGNRVRVRIGIEDSPREYRTTYDGYGRVIRVTNPAATEIDYSYDANGNMLSQKITGSSRNVSDARTRTRLFQSAQRFDNMDRRVSTEVDFFDTETQKPIGKGKSVSRIEYADNSAVIRKVDDNGHEMRTTYDTANRKRDQIDHKGNTVTFEYDDSSNIAKVIEVEKSDDGKTDQRFVTTLEYDNLERLIRVSDNSGNTNRFAYDGRRNLTLFVDALGNRSHLEYDGLRRLISTTRVLTDNGRGDGKQKGSIVTTQTWDDSSRLTSRQDPSGNVTKYAYDPLNREISETYADGSVRSYTYDVHGNRLTMKDPNGSVVQTTYNLLNRPIRRSIVPGEGVSKLVTQESYDYDSLARLTRAATDHSVVTRSYDSLSHVIREELNERKVTSIYDGVGNKLRCTYPSGREITFEYDELNRKKKIADARGALATYRYIGPSRLATRQIMGSKPAHTTNYAYDEIKRLIGMKHNAGAGGSPISDQKYAWDPMHNKTLRTDIRKGLSVLKRSYEYDSVYSLRQSLVSEREGGKGRQIQYTLDPAGNRIRVTGGARPGEYVLRPARPEPADRFMHQYNTTPFDTRRYDRNGNLIFLSSADGNTHKITYDYRDRMVEYTSPRTKTTVSYSYDALGRRITTKVGQHIADYFYDDSQIIQEVERPGGIVTTFVYGTHLNDVLNMRRGDRDLYYHADDVGSVVAITDNEGKLVEHYIYEDFGEPFIFDSQGRRLDESSVGNPYMFTGQRYDEETGLYYYRTRYLDPRAGRFTTRDTIGIWEDAGNHGNGYTYAHNNPHTFIDPYGESILRTIQCNGPWPGPAPVVIEYEGCSSSRRQGLDSPVCRAFRATGRATSDVLNLWLKDFTGLAGPNITGTGPETTRSRVAKWFGGMDNSTSLNSKSIIMSYLDDAFDALDENDVDIDCETGCDAGKTAYVNWGGSDVNLCSLFFNAGFSNSKKAAILVHELTHAYSGTDDYFYYQTDGSNAPFNQLLETPTLRENADTYEQFVLDFYT